MIAAARTAGVVLMVGYMKRYDPSYEELQRDARHGGAHVRPHHDARVADRALRVAHRRPAPQALDPEVLARLVADDARRLRAALGHRRRLPAARLPDGAARQHGPRAQRRARPARRADDAARRADLGRPSGITMTASFGDVEAVFAWIDLPGIARYAQDWSFYGPDRRATLEFPSPLLRNQPTRLVLEDGEPGGVASRRSERIVPTRRRSSASSRSSRPRSARSANRGPAARTACATSRCAARSSRPTPAAARSSGRAGRAPMPPDAALVLAAADDPGRRQPQRRLEVDGLERAPRGRPRVGRTRAARAGVDRGARLPAELARPRPVRRRSSTIGVVLGDLANTFYAELVKLLELRISEAAYTTIVCNTDGRGELERARVEMLLERAVSGVVMLQFSGDGSVLDELAVARVPVVVVSCWEERADCVAVDDRAGMAAAVEHLYATRPPPDRARQQPPRRGQHPRRPLRRLRARDAQPRARAADCSTPTARRGARLRAAGRRARPADRVRRRQRPDRRAADRPAGADRRARPRRRLGRRVRRDRPRRALADRAHDGGAAARAADRRAASGCCSRACATARRAARTSALAPELVVRASTARAERHDQRVPAPDDPRRRRAQRRLEVDGVERAARRRRRVRGDPRAGAGGGRDARVPARTRPRATSSSGART